MKNQSITIGFLALGTAGIILLHPKKAAIAKVKRKIDKFKGKVKLEPEKLGYC